MLKIKRITNDPFIPIDYRDPTELGNIRGAAVRKVNGRFNFIVKNIRAYLRENLKPIGSKQVNAQLMRYMRNSVSSINEHEMLAVNETIFDYLFGDEEYEGWAEFLNGLLYSTLLSNAIALSTYTRQTRILVIPWQDDWWMNDYISRSNEKGLQNTITSSRYQTTQKTTDRETARTIGGLSVETLTSLPGYQSNLKMKQRAAFADMKSLVEGLSSSLSETLRQAVRDGLSQDDIINKVTEKLIESDEKGKGGARKRARNLVRNRLNNARRESARENIKQLNEEVYADSPYEMRQLWFSALMPDRTRRWHGSRHGQIHTIEDDEAFYSRGGNFANCYCSQTAILVWKETGKPVTDTGLLDRMNKQKKLFLSAR